MTYIQSFDDVLPYYSFRPELQSSVLAVDLITADLKAAYDWSVHNRILNNPDKSQAIGSRVREVLQTLPFFIGDKEIPFSDTVVSLGLVLNSDLDWKNHV